MELPITMNNPIPFIKDQGMTCPICGTDKDGEVLLIPVMYNGGIESRKPTKAQVHMQCLYTSLFLQRDQNVIACMADYPHKK